MEKVKYKTLTFGKRLSKFVELIYWG